MYKILFKYVIAGFVGIGTDDAEDHLEEVLSATGP
jgi:hypothetical protein